MVKRGQVGIEYMIVVGFVTFAIITILALSLTYTNQIKDRIKMNQVESFAVQLIHSSEEVFFAGEPSKTTITLYLPEGVANINITTNYVVMNVVTSSGVNIIGYESKVPLNGTIFNSPGSKNLILEATQNHLQIS